MNIEETRNTLTILKTLYPLSFKNFNDTQAHILLNAWGISLREYSFDKVTQAIYSIYGNEKSLYMPEPIKVKEEIEKLSQPLLTTQEYDEEYHNKHCNDWVDEYITKEMWEKYFPNEKYFGKDKA